MKHFAELFARLDQTTRTSVKVKALCDFFQLADDQDKLWTIALFSGAVMKFGFWRAAAVRSGRGRHINVDMVLGLSVRAYSRRPVREWKTM